MATSRKVYSVRVNEQDMKLLKHLSVDTDKNLATLFEEAIKDLLKKYEKNAKE